jgi:hypothetical protein
MTSAILAEGGTFDPPVIHSAISPTLLLVIHIIAFVAAASWAVSIGVRRHDWTALAALIGGALCSFNEIIFDILGKIFYSSDLHSAYTAFGREMPILVILGYAVWVGFVPYFFGRAISNGVPRKRLLLLAFGVLMAMVAQESVTTPLHAWTYYGEWPIKYLGVIPQMAPLMLVSGLILYVAREVVGGWRGLILALWSPLVALPAVWAVSSWPIYNALYSDCPKWLEWVASALTIGLCALIAYLATGIAQYVRTYVVNDPVPVTGNRDEFLTRTG